MRISKFMMAAVTCSVMAANVTAADWPMWRCNAARTASTELRLADGLTLQWVRQLPTLIPAWPDQPEMEFDHAYEPVVADGRMFVGSSLFDTLTAYDVRTGNQLWEFRASGPIRLAPAAWRDRVFVGSDDGFLYCLAAADGRLLWKHQGGPDQRKLLGNDRMISMWPARGGPVVADGTVYYTAGIWPFMGIFIHALDAADGTVVWTNDGDGSRFMLQPHNTPAFAGVAPQGALVVDGDYLVVPGGRSVPACYDRRSGRFVHYELAANNKRGGGSAAAVAEQMIFNGGYAYTRDEGHIIEGLNYQGLPALTAGRAYYSTGAKLEAVAFGDPLFESKASVDRKGKPITVRKLNFAKVWSTDVDARGDLIHVGGKLFGCAGSDVFSLDLDDDKKALAWKAQVAGEAVRLLAADDRLFVVTREGAISCFGPDSVAAPVKHQAEPRAIRSDAAARARVQELLKSTSREGHAVVWGAGDGSLPLALLDESDFYLIVAEPDHARADALRTQLTAAGLYGSRAVVFVGTPASLRLPPYFAVAMFCDDAGAAGLEFNSATIARLFTYLRPYGGTACFRIADDRHAPFAEVCRQARIEQADVGRKGGISLLSRPGALPGSADWTHEHADAANTRTSRDDLVKAPLGMLWYGGPSHSAILPRHGHGPQPQVVEGRVLIEGPDLLRATDVYTGRLLWERSLPGIGTLYDNTSHHPGANGTGSNFVSLPDGIYAIYPPGCVRLDPATGKTLHEFRLPALDGATAPPIWNYVNVVDDYLVAAVDLPESMFDPKRRTYDDVVASKRLYVLDRHDGRVLWSFDAEFQFRNNAICLGGGRLYCIDLLSVAERDLWKRRGMKPLKKSRLHVFDLATGNAVWSTDTDVFGTWLSYSAPHDVLIESGRPGRDVLKDEPKGMRAFRAADGEILWSEGHSGPAIIHGDRILTDRQACELLTGRLIERTDPLTGEKVTWQWKRNYGCNTPQASRHLMLFRSGAAGYCDLANDGGTGNFGGFRSSCTNNLIAAGGVVSVPEYTRTCTCDYQNQTSLALVHMPDVEVWTEFPLTDDENVRHVAVNLGAPGSRRAADGTLWINNFTGLEMEYDDPGLYCRHSSNVSGDGELNWVAASGCRGLRRLVLDPHRKEAATYTVRLHFCDPDYDVAGRRVFDVKLQGRTVLEGFDPAEVSGGRMRPTVREFSGIRLDGATPLTVEFAPRTGAEGKKAAPILNGIELVLE